MNQQSNFNRPGDLLNRLRAVDFALVETILYLDAYPENRQALNFYHALNNERRRLTEQYEKTIGPLTATANRSTTEWDWVQSPWPWEPAAN